MTERFFLDVGGLKDCGEVENLQDQSLAMLQVRKCDNLPFTLDFSGAYPLSLLTSVSILPLTGNGFNSVQHHVTSTSSGSVGSGPVQPGSLHHNHHHRLATRFSFNSSLWPYQKNQCGDTRYYWHCKVLYTSLHPDTNQSNPPVHLQKPSPKKAEFYEKVS